jgi:phosphoglycolate phosphatase-like HAD superfamily hydrolase
MHVNIQHTVMVGDGIADMKAAVRAQSYAVGMTVSFSAQELQDVGAQQTFAMLPEVHTWLQTQIH